MAKDREILYRIDEVGKTILQGLKRYGREKSFSELLAEGNISLSDDKLIETAAVLESLDLIKSVSYQLPLTIRAELSDVGHAVVVSLGKRHRIPKNDRQLRPPNNRGASLHMRILPRFDIGLCRMLIRLIMPRLGSSE